MMKYSINPITNEDRDQVIDIFNYYVENSFAAYPEKKIPYQAFDILLQMSNGYPTGVIKDNNGKTIGFGMLRPHNPIPTFSKTAEIIYFIHHDYTGKGLGEMLLAHLEKEGKIKGIKTILANISSLNQRSIAFHLKNGFVETGRFKQVGYKNGCDFDTVWMQKML